ncbi:MAG: efflux RND transporter periplasmic adaptor subunit [Bacteroidales bacterium]
MKSRRNFTKTVIVALIALDVILAGSCKKGSKEYSFETTQVKKGTIINTITATGTLEADTTVLIGTQVSGVINKIFVDFNSVVKKHQLLAVLDTTPLQTQVRQSQASLDQSKGEMEYQGATFERYQALLDKKLIAQADYDQVKYNYSTARANLKTAQAGYDKAVVNLNYAYITSPILGVVLNRAVDQGQTVASSFSTPNLFTVANDLTQMHVEANVDEADIGQVKQGQPVDFTVDAFPTEIFKGDVRQIRLQPIVTSNVVTYTVIVNAPNPEKKLMPGMTANITVLVQKVDSVLTVPGKALRFTPDAPFLAEYMKNNPMGQRQGTGGAGRPAGTGGTPGTAGTGGTTGTGSTGATPGTAANQPNPGGFQAGGQAGKKPVVVWVKEGDKVRRVRVATGAIDGSNAEIKFGLKEGDEVILSMTLGGKSSTTTAAAPTTTSPFMPTRPAGGRGR